MHRRSKKHWAAFSRGNRHDLREGSRFVVTFPADSMRCTVRRMVSLGRVGVTTGPTTPSHRLLDPRHRFASTSLVNFFPRPIHSNTPSPARPPSTRTLPIRTPLPAVPDHQPPHVPAAAAAATIASHAPPTSTHSPLPAIRPLPDVSQRSRLAAPLHSILPH